MNPDPANPSRVNSPAAEPAAEPSTEPSTERQPRPETPPRPTRLRLDKLLVEHGHAASRERAQALILAGRVLVNDQRIDKSGTPVASDALIRLLGDDLRYVSRGGLKLERALAHWHLDLTDRNCLDIGTSTGGFTDCMLQHGARSVLSIDTGYGQIAERLRTDPRVRLMERTNARLLEPDSLVIENALTEPQPDQPHPAPTPTFLAMDVSFISATLVLPSVLAALGEPWRGTAVILIKPQFEAGREHVGKGGIVRDPAARTYAIDRVRDCAQTLGATHLDLIDSPIRGMEGNHEYLLRASFNQPATFNEPASTAAPVPETSPQPNPSKPLH